MTEKLTINGKITDESAENKGEDEGRIPFVSETVDMNLNPGSSFWIDIVEQNLEFARANFNREHTKLRKELEECERYDTNTRCKILRKFTARWYRFFDSDMEILVHWAVRNPGAAIPGDREYVVARHEFHQEVRKIKGDSKNFGCEDYTE
jgi:hypothetical protein